MKTLFLTLLFLSSTLLCAQTYSSTNPEYIKLVKQGEGALIAEKYDSCIFYYKEAFVIKQTSFLSTMRAAACGFSSDNQEYYNDQLDKAIEISWGGAKQVFDSNENLAYLKGTAFEDDLMMKYKAAAIASGVDLELMKEFENINYEDQRYRKEMRGVSDTYGWDSPQMDSLWSLQNPADSINQIRICQILDERGYPGKTMVGQQLQSTAFLVIQHADTDLQLKYLPIFKEAADNGEIRWGSVALMIDRANLGTDKPQIYGSQIGTDKESGEKYFFEIEQPHKVDSLRASVGLGPIQEYGDHWNLTWDADKHIEKIKAMKEKEK